jgi:hypothetical protein
MNQLDNLLSEYRFLEKMIADAPKNAVIGRLSLTARLQAVREEIEELKKETENDFNAG